MNCAVLPNGAESLLILAQALEIPESELRSGETFDKLTYTQTRFDPKIVDGLDLTLINQKLAIFGDSFAGTFRLGDEPVLVLRSEISAADITTFKKKVGSSPFVEFHLEFNKEAFIGLNLKTEDYYHFVLYVFPENLKTFLTSDLKTLETKLLGDQWNRKVIILVFGQDSFWDGAYFAVIGGKEINRLDAVIPKTPPDAQIVRDMYQNCQDILRWQDKWLQGLTPLHLKIEGTTNPNNLLDALFIHRLNLFLLYTADRTVSRDAIPQISQYSVASQTVEVPHWSPAVDFAEADLQSVAHLQDLLEWTYDEDHVSDRMTLVQIVFVKELDAVQPAARSRKLLDDGGRIFKDIELRWRSFIQGKIEAYTAQEQALEDYVEGTIQTFSGQISSMIKSLTDTMLAAVGALFVSFVAAIFKEKFEPFIFLTGAAGFSIYVLCFPLLYNMFYQRVRYQELVAGFEIRRKRFEERLFREKVCTVVGSQIIESKKRFEIWFWITVVIYVLVVVLTPLFAYIIAGYLLESPTIPVVK